MALDYPRQTGRDSEADNRVRWAEQHFGYVFGNPDLLLRALTHRSASKENNERLEFLGDAFLNYSIAKQLYEIHPNCSEGDLSRFRAALVKGETLSEVGRELGLEKHIILGEGELRDGGSQRDSILANTLEAVIGAVLLDGGVEAVNLSVFHLFAERIQRLPDPESLKDSKTRLQEWLQHRGLPLPDYSVKSASGLSHQQSFTVSCFVPEKGIESSGVGKSRRSAEQNAAAEMFLKLSNDSEKQ